MNQIIFYIMWRAGYLMMRWHQDAQCKAGKVAEEVSCAEKFSAGKSLFIAFMRILL